jgi:5-methylcytosine-specific restriction endonuclease McrA
MQFCERHGVQKKFYISYMAWRCLECQKEYGAKYRSERPDKKKASGVKYRIKNREKEKVRKEKYYAENSEKVNAYYAKWAKRNPEKVKAYRAKYFSENSEKYNADIHARIARIAGNGGKYTVKEWNDLCETYNNKCLCCGRSDVKLTVDHVVPLSKGGVNFISNIQPLCGSCNSSKGTKVIDYRK